MRYHFSLVMLTNLAIVALLIYKVWTGNDKAPILFIFYYPLLILANTIAWSLLKAIKLPAADIYKNAVRLLIILLIPAILVSNLL